MAKTTTEELAKSLESLYTEGKFQEARELLLEHKMAYPKGHFHYNLGTLYAQEGHLAAGRYHLEKAISENFVNPMALNNLETLKGKLAVQDLSSSENFYDQAIDFSLLVPAGLWLSGTLILFLALWVLVRIKKLVSRAAIEGVAAVALMPLAYSTFYLGPIDYAMTLQEAPIHNGPSKIYLSNKTLPAGSKIIVGRENNGWYLIEHPLNLSGWVYKDTLGLY